MTAALWYYFSAPLTTGDFVIYASAHSHASDVLSLSSRHTLVISPSWHAHTSDTLELTAVFALVIEPSRHAHTSDVLSLTTLAIPPVITMADALAVGIALLEPEFIGVSPVTPGTPRHKISAPRPLVISQ